MVIIVRIKVIENQDCCICVNKYKCIKYPCFCINKSGWELIPEMEKVIKGGIIYNDRSRNEKCP